MGADRSRDANTLSILSLTPDPDPSLLSPDADDAWARASAAVRLGPLDGAVPLILPFAALSTSPESAPPIPAYVRPEPTALPTASPGDAAAAIRAWRQAASADGFVAAGWAHALAVAQRHARCLGADASRPDVPLLALRGLASALATCFLAGTDQLGILVADLSGIQPYLFEISEVGVGGVARSLRARSFFISQISALLAREVGASLGLGPHNTILDAGGKFHTLFPWTEEALARIERLRSDAARWCLRTLHGELAVNMAIVPVERRDLEPGRFGDALTRADVEITARKRRRLADVLVKDGAWVTDAFLADAAWQDSEPCHACGRFRSDPGQTKCSLCLADERRGRTLTSASWVAYRRQTPGASSDIAAFGWCAQIGSGPPPHDAEAWLFDPRKDTQSPATPYRFVARHVPVADGGEHLTFEDMAAAAEGRPYLAYLKADVDRLGERLALGLCRDTDEPYDEPGRIAHISSALEEFFAGRLHRIVEREFPLCYVVFSGGDDLTVVGPHNEIVALALRVASDFRAYTGYPPGAPMPTDTLTLSAGIAFAQRRRPLAVAVDIAEQALHQAKQDGRCRAHLFGQSLLWADLAAAYSAIWNADRTRTPLGAELLDPRCIPSALVYHLLKYARMWQAFRAGDTSQMRYQPLLAYEIGRNIERSRAPNTHRWASRLAQLELGDESADWRDDMDRLGVVARLVILNRSGSSE